MQRCRECPLKWTACRSWEIRRAFDAFGVSEWTTLFYLAATTDVKSRLAFKASSGASMEVVLSLTNRQRRG